ncbi:MAG: class I SAM-dependent RNA methyltransferase [Ruminococcus sp.]|nr:class I SAM-dependent RNA methyltransferase [Ruminococcus sp.]
MRFRFVVPCHFGLESVLSYEVKKLGGEEVTVSDGKVSFSGDELILAKANLWIASGERVLIEVGSFRADSFDMLFEGVKALPWEEYIAKTDCFPVVGHCLNSKLHSVPDCQSIIKKAIVTRLGKAYGIARFEETGARHRIRFSIHKDIASITLDTSGDGLHKRGYRRISNAAPIKETLAAGIVDLARVRADSTVVDPMCGSGTLLIEAAYKAHNIAPGLRRTFEAQGWQQISSNVWQQARSEAMDMIVRDTAFKAYGFDIDEFACELTAANAKKAGVSSKIEVKCRDIAHHTPIENSITVVNPPYGERLLEIKQAEELYKKLGQKLRPDKDYPCYVISPHEDFEKFFGKKADKKRKLYNGMIKCDLYMYFR